MVKLNMCMMLGGTNFHIWHSSELAGLMYRNFTQIVRAFQSEYYKSDMNYMYTIAMIVGKP